MYAEREKEAKLFRADIARLHEELDMIKKTRSSGGIPDFRVSQLEYKLREAERELGLRYQEIHALRRDKASLYDVASDAQNYSILIERLLKAEGRPGIVWHVRSFVQSLKGVRE